MRAHRRWLRRVVKLLAILVIALAALSATLRLLLPWLVGDPQRVAQFLSERLRTPVTLEGSEAHVLGTGPLVHLKGLRIGDAPALYLAEADLEIDFAAFVLPWRRIIRDVRVSGLDIRIERNADGIRVLGLPRPRVPPPWQAWLGRLGQVSIRNSRLRFTDTLSDSEFSVAAFSARAQRRNGELRFGAALGRDLRLAGRWLPEAEQPLTLWLGGTAEATAVEGVPAGDGLRLLGITPVQGQLKLDARARIGRGGALTWQGRLDVNQLVYESATLTLSEARGALAFRHAVSSLGLRWQGQRQADGGWALDWQFTGPDAPEPARGALARSAEGQLRGAVEDLSLGPVADLASATGWLPDALAERLYLSAPTGRIERLAFQRGVQPGDWWLDGRLQALALRGWEPRVPEVSGLDVDFQAAAGGATFQLSAQAGELKSALMFKAPIPFALTATGSIAAAEAAGRIRIEIDHYDAQSKAGRSAGHLQLEVGAERPAWLDLSGRVLGGDMEAARQFWVLNKLPARAVQWLDRALVSGNIVGGAAVYRGELGKPAWPFAEQQGRFQAVADVRAAVVDYHPDWPRATVEQAALLFTNDGLQVTHAGGQVGTTRITAQLDIPVFKEPILTASFQGEGDARGWLSFLRSSPVGMVHGSQLVGMEVSGPVLATAQLKLPLKRSLGEAVLDGRATLEGVDFKDPKWLLDFRALKGSARFTRAGFAGEGISLRTPAGSAGELSLAVGLTADPAKVVESAMVGRFSTQDLFGHHEVLSPILARINGRSDWQLELAVPRGADSGPATLKMFSNLLGTTIDMPAPLGKDALGTRALSLSVGLPLEAALPLSLKLGDAARFEARLGTATQDFSGVLRLGSGAVRAAPPRRGLWLEGSVPDHQPQAWIGLISSLVSGSGSEDSGFAGADLEVTGPQAQIGSLKILPVADGWTVDIVSGLATGKLRWELRHGQEGIHGDFQSLHLPSDSTGGASLGVHPALFPALHIRAEDFRMGAAQLGSLRLETFPTAAGMQIELMETRSPVLELRGSGAWTGLGPSQQTRFDLRFSAQDAGRMLSSLGFAGQMSGGQTLSTLKASWPGAPSDFGLERLDGGLDIWIGNGRFLDVEPGAGRLFGLLSLSELPRRLSLDFRDFFQSGMAFDEIRGRFALNEGNAWTEDLAIKAPAANVLIYGRTGIAARDYDQQMVVTPKVGGVLPIVGALAGGPGGAAAGLLAQRMFSGERSAFLREYRIGGTWDKPQIERQEQRRSPLRGATDPPG